MGVFQNFLAVAFFAALLLTAVYINSERDRLPAQCCQECKAAFAQSPVGVGPEGARCGGFASGKPLSKPCEFWFDQNVRTVAQC